MHYLYKYLIRNIIILVIIDGVLLRVGGHAIFVAGLISAGFLIYTIVMCLTVYYNK